jgi:hypothetical protein
MRIMAGKSPVVASAAQRRELMALSHSRDRGEADRIEAALLTLGDEEAVDAEDRGEEQRRPEDAGGEAAGEAGAVEAEAEDDEGGDREQDHRGHRLSLLHDDEHP